ncbi:MAG: hypothetical protein WB586_30320 [Chthoniobacterales bacterium]
MNKERQGDHCGICDAVTSGDSTVCAECGRAFGPALLDKATSDESPLDLEKYCCQMFPWEPSRNRPRLIISDKTSIILAVGLVVVVVLLALLRAPLPSCWELL